MKIVSRLKTVATDKDYVKIAYDVFSKASKNICPNGKLAKNISVEIDSDKFFKGETAPVNHIALHFDYPKGKALFISIFPGRGSGLLVTPVGLDDSIRATDFNDTKDILSDYSYFVNDGWESALEAFEKVNSLVSQ